MVYVYAFIDFVRLYDLNEFTLLRDNEHIVAVFFGMIFCSRLLRHKSIMVSHMFLQIFLQAIVSTKPYLAAGVAKQKERVEVVRARRTEQDARAEEHEAVRPLWQASSLIWQPHETPP